MSTRVHSLTRILCAALASALTAVLGTAQGQVWVVAAAPGPGVDFAGSAALQQAVDAASDGDLVLVKAGTYSAFHVDARSLILVAEAGAVVRPSGMIRVSNLSASQSVAFRGIGKSSGSSSRIRCEQNAGPIWIEDEIFADYPPGGGLFYPPYDLVQVDQCSSVALQRVTTGVYVGFYGFTSGVGVLAQGSAVHVFDSTIRGGDAFMLSFWPTYFPAPASDGANVSNGFLFAAGSTLQGGNGANCVAQFMSCLSGAPGADGLELSAGSHAEMLETNLKGGVAGTGGCGFSCSGGAAGMDLHLAGGTLGSLQEVSRSFQVSSPVRAGQSATLQASGNPADIVIALFSARQQHLFLPNLGTLLVPLDLGGETGLFVLGATDATGALQVPLALPLFPPGLEFLAFYMQAAFVGPQLVTILSGGSLLVVLNQSF